MLNYVLLKAALKIAIYSGEIPSSTFIERLIKGVAAAGAEVMLFGVLHNLPAYSSKVKVIGYRQTRLSKFWHLVRFSIVLSLFKRKEKKRLDAYLKQQQKTDLYTKVKYYPVLWYQPDVFHLQWAKGLDDWLWVQDFGMKLVVSLRGAHINYSPIADPELAAIYCQNFPKVDAFHAVSKAIGIEAQKYGAPAYRVHVVYSGLDLSSLAPSERKASQGQPVFKLISVGRPHWKKGYPYALDACKLLKEKGFQFEYIIIGGADAIEYQYQIYDLGLEKQVRLVKQESFEEVQTGIQEADLLLLPSVEEGIANVALEAMALGTLVLSTNCGGMSEVITDDSNGFLTPIRDAKAIADAIVRIQQLSTADALAVRKRAQAKIEEQHTEEMMVRGMLGLYERVIASREKGEERTGE